MAAENADLARGYANVVVLSPFGGRTGTLPAGQFEGLRKFPGADLTSQVEAAPEGDAHIDAPDPVHWADVAREDHAAADGRPAYSYRTFRRKNG